LRSGRRDVLEACVEGEEREDGQTETEDRRSACEGSAFTAGPSLIEGRGEPFFGLTS